MYGEKKKKSESPYDLMIGHPLFVDLSKKRASFAGLRQRGNAR